MKVISADSHLDLGWLPRDAFTSRVPASWKDRVPRVVETPDGPQWTADGVPLGGVAGVGSLGRPYVEGKWRRADEMKQTGLYDDGLHRPANPEGRIQDQDRDGICAEVIYGIFGLTMQIDDIELASVINVTFNDWFADFCQSHPDRYIGLANLPGHDARAAAAELRRAIGLGFRGVVMDGKNGYRPLYHKDWYPLWAAAQELGVPISFHASHKRGEVGKIQGDPERGDPRVDAALSQAGKPIASQSDYFGLIFGGTFDAFPDLQVVIAETGIGWIPTFLQRMDYVFDNEYRALGLKLRPSEYWHRQMYGTFESDLAGLRQLDLLGEDHVMFGSDYPHPNGLFPGSQRVIEATMSHLSDPVRSKVLHDNAVRVYGLE
jgi:uncharacterized protein